MLSYEYDEIFKTSFFIEHLCSLLLNPHFFSMILPQFVL